MTYGRSTRRRCERRAGGRFLVGHGRCAAGREPADLCWPLQCVIRGVADSHGFPDYSHLLLDRTPGFAEAVPIYLVRVLAVNGLWETKRHRDDFMGRNATRTTPTAKTTAVSHGKRPSGAKPPWAKRCRPAAAIRAPASMTTSPQRSVSGIPSIGSGAAERRRPHHNSTISTAVTRLRMTIHSSRTSHHAAVPSSGCGISPAG